MNREIRLRVWNAACNEMVYPQIVPTNLGISNLTSGQILHRFDEENIMQYTGLKDMNGKEIYEGDIVKSTWVIDNGADISENVTVVFNDGSFWEGETLLGDSHQSVEIIGNIYEHPHLLNPKP